MAYVLSRQLFRHVLACTAQLCPEVTLELVPGTGIRIRSLDPACVALVDCMLSEKGMAEVKWGGQRLFFVLGIWTADWHKVLSRASMSHVPYVRLLADSAEDEAHVEFVSERPPPAEEQDEEEEGKKKKKAAVDVWLVEARFSFKLANIEKEVTAPDESLVPFITVAMRSMTLFNETTPCVGKTDGIEFVFEGSIASRSTYVGNASLLLKAGGTAQAKRSKTASKPAPPPPPTDEVDPWEEDESVGTKAALDVLYADDKKRKAKAPTPDEAPRFITSVMHICATAERGKSDLPVRLLQNWELPVEALEEETKKVDGEKTNAWDSVDVVLSERANRNTDDMEMDDGDKLPAAITEIRLADEAPAAAGTKKKTAQVSSLDIERAFLALSGGVLGSKFAASGALARSTRTHGTACLSNGTGFVLQERVRRTAHRTQKYSCPYLARAAAGRALSDVVMLSFFETDNLEVAFVKVTYALGVHGSYSVIVAPMTTENEGK